MSACAEASVCCRSRCGALELAAVRIAEPGIAATGSFSCAGRMRGEALADEDDRLAPFAHPAQLHRRALQRAHRDLVADLLDRRAG